MTSVPYEAIRTEGPPCVPMTYPVTGHYKSPQTTPSACTIFVMRGFVEIFTKKFAQNDH